MKTRKLPDKTSEKRTKLLDCGLTSGRQKKSLSLSSQPNLHPFQIIFNLKRLSACQFALVDPAVNDLDPPLDAFIIQVHQFSMKDKNLGPVVKRLTNQF